MLLRRFLIAGTLIVASCVAESALRSENVRPFLNLTVVSPEEHPAGSPTFRWTGWDTDGSIDHYEFAIDIPDSVSTESINDPEYTGVAWERTTQGEMRFPSAEEHSFFVRAVDNEGAPSEADSYCFSNGNIHPKTALSVSLPIVDPVLHFCGNDRQILLRWGGFDPDGSDLERKPAFYEWKLIRMEPVQMLPPTDLTFAVLVFPGPETPWTRTEGDSALMTLESPRGYILAVRAIDENGGTENRFIRWRNAVVLETTRPGDETPVLMVSEPTLGSHDFSREGPIARYDVPPDATFRFRFAADASSYGGAIRGYNWGVDVTEVRNGDEFHGWSPVPFSEPVTFETPGVHNVVVKVRDSCDRETIGTILLNVIGAPLEGDLYVDDGAGLEPSAWEVLR